VTKIDEAFIREAARVAGVEIPPARLPEVLANLQRTEQVAEALFKVELDPQTDEMAPVWRP
jgi:hypothetical protein